MFPHIEPPCGGCSRRAVGCHGSCAAYREYTEALNAARASREEIRAGALEASAVRRSAVIRAGKQKRQKPCMKRGRSR